MLVVCAALVSCGATPQLAVAQMVAQMVAQTGAAAPEMAPKMSVSEQTALGALSEKLQANAQERQKLVSLVQQVEAQMAREHAGWHFDEQTMAMVRDMPPGPAPKAGEAAPAATPKP